MKNLHINAPQVTDKTIKTVICPDCKKRTRMLSFFSPWYGWESTCMKYGRPLAEGEWIKMKNIFHPVDCIVYAQHGHELMGCKSHFDKDTL